MGKRKFKRGRFIERRTWRDIATLLPIKEEWIKMGTTVIYDFCKAYDCLIAADYLHLKVNQSVNSNDPIIGAHTNSIKGAWRNAKTFTVSNDRKQSHICGNLARYTQYIDFYDAIRCPYHRFFRFLN